MLMDFNQHYTVATCCRLGQENNVDLWPNSDSHWKKVLIRVPQDSLKSQDVMCFGLLMLNSPPDGDLTHIFITFWLILSLHNIAFLMHTVNPLNIVKCNGEPLHFYFISHHEGLASFKKTSSSAWNKFLLTNTEF